MTFSGSIRFFILFTLLLQSIGLGIVNPVVPRLMEKFSSAETYSVSTLFGWSLAIFSLAVFMSAPLLGRLSDRFGRRPIVLISLAGSIIDHIVAATTTQLWVFLVARAVAGALAAGGASIQAAVADVTPPERRAQNFSAVGAAFSCGFIIGPLVGGLIGELGTTMPFWTAAALSTLALLLGLTIFKETLPVSHRRALTQGSFNPIAALRGIRRFNLGGLLAIFVILNAGLSLADPIGILFMQARFGWGTSEIGLYMFMAGAGMLVSRLTLTPLAVNWLGERGTILFGMLSLLTCMILCNIVWQSWQMYIVLSFMLLGSVTFPTLMGVMSKGVESNSQGELQGSLASVQSAMGVLGAPIGTSIFAYFTGPTAPFTLYGAPMLVCGIFIATACIMLLRVREVSKVCVAAQADAGRAG